MKSVKYYSDLKRQYGHGLLATNMCAVVLMSKLGPWVKVMTHSSVMGNNCVKYYLDRTCGKELRYDNK